MLALSQTTGYAILALSCLDEKAEKLVLAKSIARRTGIPKPYLSRILYDLAQSGVIMSKRGYKGGVALSKPALEISLMEIAEAVRGEEWQKSCLLGLAECSDQRACPVHDFWKPVREEVENKLREVTLAEAAQFEKEWRKTPKSRPKARTSTKTTRGRTARKSTSG